MNTDSVGDTILLDRHEWGLNIMATQIKVVDSAGRIAIGKDLKGKTCSVDRTDHGKVILTFVSVIPERELWLLKNPELLKQLDKSMEEKGEEVSLDELIDL